MQTFEVSYSVNNIRGSEIVKCSSPFDAKKLIEQKYKPAKVTFWNVKVIA